jgi:hypothetical protein
MAVWGLALFLEARVSIAAGKEPVGRSVIVFVRQDNLLVADLGRAERTATRIFASIGVVVTFRAGAERKPTGEGAVSIEMRLDANAPAQLRSETMAYAMPFGVSGTRSTYSVTGCETPRRTVGQEPFWGT